MAESSKGRTLLIRTLTASVLLPITLLFLYLGKIYVLLFVLVIINISLIEFLRFGHRKAIYPYPACLFLPANIVPIGIFFSLPVAYLGTILFIYIVVLSLLRFKQGEFAGRITLSLFAIFYLGVLPSSIIPLRNIGFSFSLYPLALTWIFDTGAYFVGSAIGRHKLATLVSPKKSYEGLAGGFLFALPATYGLNQWFKSGFPLFDVFAITIGIAIMSTLGDLFESAFKREINLKDTSSLFPGHGGMLDRVDSLLFTIPFFYLFLRLRGF